MILCKLEDGKLRYSQLRDAIEGIIERMLTLQLRELEKDRLVKWIVYAEVPARVEYEMTPIAEERIPIWAQLSKWGAKHRELFDGGKESR